MDEAKIRSLIEDYNEGRISDSDKKDLLYYIELYPEIVFYPNAEDALDAYNYKHHLIEKAKKGNRKKISVQVYYAAAAIVFIIVSMVLVNIYKQVNQNNNTAKVKTKLENPTLAKSDSIKVNGDLSDYTVKETIFKLAIISNTKLGYSENKKGDSITFKFIESNLKADEYKFENGIIEIKSNSTFHKMNSAALYLKFDNFTKGYYIYRNGILYPIQKTSEFSKLKKEEDQDIISFAKSLIKK